MWLNRPVPNVDCETILTKIHVYYSPTIIAYRNVNKNHSSVLTHLLTSINIILVKMNKDDN